jgi:hypothetical protein
MSEFSDRQAALTQARAKAQTARRTLHRAEQAERRAAAALARFERTGSSGRASDRTRASLEAAATEARAATAAARKALGPLDAAQVRAFGAFHELVRDPRRQIGELDGSVPIVMLPLRLETRFRDQNLAGRRGHFLWIRAYPDDCAIDTFEELPSDSELAALRAFWVEWWKAGGHEALERGAWRGLVASVGAGRASWLVGQHAPDLTTAPVKAERQDVVLVIVASPPAVPKERDAILAFWVARWRAGGDGRLLAAAREALDDAVTPARAQTLLEELSPENPDEPVPAGVAANAVLVIGSFLVLPARPASQETSWSQGPKVFVLPDRLAVLGYSGETLAFEQFGSPIPSPLQIAPDPGASGTEQLQLGPNGELVVPEAMKWVTDFPAAVTVGMGFEIDLDKAAASSGIPGVATEGLSRLLVVGVRLASNATESATQFETLLVHHKDGRAGISILPQGTPTNNTDDGGAAFSRGEDADASFDRVWGTAAQAETELEAVSWAKQSDGRRLANAFGLAPALFDEVPGSKGHEGGEALAMNAALFPGTLGYMLQTLMHPAFDSDTVELTRKFFTTFVTGRGLLPALRIGRQPYGVLPAAAFSRLSWNGLQLPREFGASRAFSAFVPRLSDVLSTLSSTWREKSREAAFVGKAGDPHALLLDILGLHASSVEYHQRFVESLDDLWNRAAALDFASGLGRAFSLAGKVANGEALLARFGLQSSPDLLYKVFLDGQNLLGGPIVDEVPLSETEPVRASTDDQRNYLEWLRDELPKSVETVRAELGFPDGAPRALLYILLRHAALRAAWESGLRLHVSAELMTLEEAQLARREPPFIHIQGSVGETTRGASPWSTLYKSEPAITGEPERLVVDFLPQTLAEARPEGAPLADVVNAVGELAQLPTARLERLFAEHVDLCSYRLDAWRLGLLHYRLVSRRFSEGRNVEGAPGLYLGAYGYVEDLRPRAATRTPAEIPEDLSSVFAPAPEVDSANAGYIHAPSLNHAVTAAVLRNAHLTHRTPGGNELAVNLSSERVRRALSILEGVQGGQSLGALLGYQLERGLHERHGLAEVDKFIFPLRLAFPLRANRLNETAVTDPNVPIEAIEARNVVDGLRFSDHLRALSERKYPFDVALPPASDVEIGALEAEIERLLDTRDALADLMLAEGVHQAAQANYDRSAAALDVVGKGRVPAELPDVVRTPRGGITLTHRVALHFEAGVAPSPVSPPRVQAQPGLSRWVGGILPPANEIVAVVAVAGAAPTTVSLAELALDPLELLYLSPGDGAQAMAELDDRILRFVYGSATPPRPDRTIVIRYTERVTDLVGFFELGPLLRSLRSLVLKSRPLRASDAMLQGEATRDDEVTGEIDRNRVSLPLATLKALSTAVDGFVNARSPLLADASAQRAAIIAGVDATLEQAVELLARAARFGLAQTGWGFAYEWRRTTFLAILLRLDEVADRWDERLLRFQAELTALDELPNTATDDERLLHLQRAERLVSNEVTGGALDLQAYRGLVLDKHDSFETKRGTLNPVLNTAERRVAALLALAKARLPLAPFDVEEPSFDDIEDLVVRFVSDVVEIFRKLSESIAVKVTDVESKLLAHDGSVGAKRAALLRAAGKVLFGDDLELLPEFTPGAEHAAEWLKAHEAGAPDGPLLDHLTRVSKRDEPVRDWLFGVARVREKLRHFEQLVLWTGAFGRPEPELHPVQLPFQLPEPPDPPGSDPVPVYHWLALEHPPKAQRPGERLLYTAHYAKPFAAGKQTGVLLDEWTELLPAEQETTGLTFHHDRPQSEAPQAFLLLTSPEVGKPWAWADVVDAVSETFDLVKQRAVEPAHVDASPLGRFLPATLVPVTLYELTISANLGINNLFFSKASAGPA